MVLGLVLEYATSTRSLPSEISLVWMLQNPQKRTAKETRRIDPQKRRAKRDSQKRPARDASLLCPHAHPLSNSVSVSSSTSQRFKMEKIVFVPNPPRASCRKMRAACF